METSRISTWAFRQQNSSVRTAFLLLNSMIGSGILNQPQVYRKSGFLAAIIMTVVSAYFTWVGLVCLIEAGRRCKARSYPELGRRVWGSKGENIVNISIAVYNLGSIMSYIIIIGSTSSELMCSWGCTATDACNRYITTSCLLLVVALPLCLHKIFGHLAIYSFVSIISISSVVMLTVIGGPIVGDRSGHLLFIDGLLTKIGSIVFALSCSSAAFPIFEGGGGRDREDLWDRTAGGAVAAGALLLIIMGTAGYASFGSETNDIITRNFSGHHFDEFKVLLVVHLLLYIPVDFLTMRFSVLRLCGKSSGDIESHALHGLFTAALLASTAALVFVLYASGESTGNSFSLVLDLTGGIFGSLIGYVFPGLFYLLVLSGSFKGLDNGGEGFKHNADVVDKDGELGITTANILVTQAESQGKKIDGEETRLSSSASAGGGIVADTAALSICSASPETTTTSPSDLSSNSCSLSREYKERFLRANCIAMLTFGLTILFLVPVTAIVNNFW